MKSALHTESDLPSAAPIEEHWVTLDGARMRYLRCGSGPPLLLLHGLMGYSFSWRFALPVLAQQATVFAIDMLGAGFSERPKGLDCRLEPSAERLLRFLDQVGVTCCDLLATSHGGAVAMTAAALAPDRVKRMILVAPANPWAAHGRRLAPFLSSRFIAPLFRLLMPHLRVAHTAILRRLVADPGRLRPGTLEGYEAPFSIPGSFEYPLAVLRSWTQDLAQLKSVLPHIAQIPALLLWGSLDRAVDPASATPLAQQFKTCRIVMFEGVGHLPYEEVPDKFNRVVAEFLVRGPQGHTRP